MSSVPWSKVPCATMDGMNKGRGVHKICYEGLVNTHRDLGGLTPALPEGGGSATINPSIPT